MRGPPGRTHKGERSHVARGKTAEGRGPRTKRPTPQDDSGLPRRKRRGRPFSLAAAAAVIFVLSFSLYANTLGHDFIWDDFGLVVNNPTLRPLDATAVTTAFTERFLPVAHRTGDYYRPLTTLSYNLNYSLSGRRPGSYHWMNVVMNALVSAAVFLLVALVFEDAVLGFVTALLFAAHPIHTENVAWVAGRTDIGAAFWMLVSLIFYVKFKRRRSRASLGLSLAAFAVALLFKESAACLPLVVGLFELGALRKLFNAPSQKAARGPTIVAVGLFGAVLGLYLIGRHEAIGTLLSKHSANTAGPMGAVALPFSILAGYVFKLIAPLSMNAEYDAPVPSSLLHPHAIAGLLIFALIVWTAVRYRHRPVIVLGAGIFLVGLLPVSNIVPIGDVSAERFLYFPSLGFVLVLGGIFSPALAARIPSLRGSVYQGRGWILRPPVSERPVLVLLLALVVAGYSVRTLARNGDWRNEAVFFAKTAAQSPNNARAQFNLGDAQRAQGDLAGAVLSYKRALELRPGYEEALSNLAGVYAQQGDYDKGVALIEQAMMTMPDNARLANNLGALYMEKQDYAKAEALFERAIELDPREFSAHLGLGMIRSREGNASAARDHFLQAARGGPSMALAYFHLAILERSEGNNARAKEYAGLFLSQCERDDPYRRQAEAISAGR